MSKDESLNLKLDVIKAIPFESLKRPGIPVDTYIQEASDLHHWCQADKDALVAAGIDWTRVDDLPVRIGALSAAQAIWISEYNNKEAAQKQWGQQFPAAFQLRDQIVHHFRYAYRDDPDLYGRVKAIANGGGNAGMLQDLQSLFTLGKSYPELLAKINFDMSLLDQAALLSEQLSPLLSIATGGRMEYNESKRLRDRAYFHLKEVVDEVRKCGKYLFWRNADRLKGYNSSYLQRRKNKKKTDSAPTSDTDTVTMVGFPQTTLPLRKTA